MKNHLKNFYLAMDHPLFELKMEEKPDADVNQWETLGTNNQSLVVSRMSFSREDYQLKYIPQNDETRSKRPVIPTTRLERLAYFRGFTSTPSKTQIVCMHHVDFNRFFWHYVIDLFLKSLPHTFVYIFLASYAPDEHFFLAKMVPFLSGIRISYILGGIIDMVSYTDTVIGLLDYSLCGLLYKTPWNRCPTNQSGSSIICYESEDFVKKFANETPVFNITAYISSSGELFQMAPLYYHSVRAQYLSTLSSYGSINLIYFLFIWIFIAVHYNQLKKRYIWKALHVIQMALAIIYIIVFVHLSIHLFLNKDEIIAEVPIYKLLKKLWNADVDTIAESMAAPPTVHILTARSSQEIQPTRDSATIIVSNAIFYIFRGLLSYKVKRYCDLLIKSPMFVDVLNTDSFFFIWPVYFSTLYLGEIFCHVFFILNFFMEFYILVVTFHCLVEAIVCEWKELKRIIVTIVITTIGILFYAFSNYYVRFFLYLLTKGFVTLLEIYGIYIIYPLGRLMADMTFYTGLVLTNFQTIFLRIVPLWYTVFFFNMLHIIFQVMLSVENNDFVYLFFWSVVVILLPLIMGAAWSVFFYIWKKNKSWTSLFRPDDTWGPDPHIRQLRKQYESRAFVRSQAPRELSRFMIRRAKSKVYNIDIPYD